MLKISVGSTNPVKLNATAEAFELINGEAEVIKLDVDSEVSDQPSTDEEAIEGAKIRAEKSIKKGDYDFGVGLEGSVADSKYGMFLTGWAYLINSESSYLGGGGRLLLPEPIAERVRGGEELGPVMDEVTGKKEVKEGPGAIGIFTDGIITRQQAYRDAIIFALASYLNPELYR